MDQLNLLLELTSELLIRASTHVEQLRNQPERLKLDDIDMRAALLRCKHYVDLLEQLLELPHEPVPTTSADEGGLPS